MDEILEVDGVNETPEVKTPRIGQFKTKDKFIEFVGGKGNVNFLTDEAFVESKYLSGSLSNDIKFKLTICDEGTVDFEEVDTNFTTPEERQRLLDLISDKTLSPSRIKHHFIVSEVPFIATKQINGRDMNVYLAVEYQTPISKLASIFDDEDDIVTSQEQDSKLDQLLSMFDDEPVEAETIEETIEDEPIVEEVKSGTQKMLEESFKKMKEEKVQELKNKIEHQQKELARYESEKRNAERKLEEAKDDIKLLESRLDTLVPNAEPNGYIFFVSEELNQKVNIPSDIEAIIREKVAKVKGINIEGFMKLFEGGEYQIRLGKIENDETVEVTDYENLTQEIKDQLDFLHLHEDKLIHHGDLKWHDLIQKMLKLGFEQSSEFDKMCGSSSFGSNGGDTNTYHPRTESSDTESDQIDAYKDAIKSMAQSMGLTDVEFGEDGISLVGETKTPSLEIKSQTVRTYDEETTLVVMGTIDHNDNRDVEITDDYTSFEVYVGDKKIKGFYESDGFISIMTLSEFKKWQSQYPDAMTDGGAVDSFLLPNFKGTIGVTAMVDGEFTSDFDLSDYIQHQLEDAEIFLTLPEGTDIMKMDDYHQVPVAAIRDIKINKIVK